MTLGLGCLVSNRRSTPPSPGLQGLLGLLSQQQPESLLDDDAIAGKLVVWGESRRVRRLGRLAARAQLLHGVDTLSGFVQIVHEKHLVPDSVAAAGVYS